MLGSKSAAFSYLCQFLVMFAWTRRLATCIEMVLKGGESCTVYDIVITRSIKPHTAMGHSWMLEEVGIGEPCFNCLLLYCTMNIQFIRGYSRSEGGRAVPQEGPLLPARRPVSGLRRTQSSCCVYASKAAGRLKGGTNRSRHLAVCPSIYALRKEHRPRAVALLREP